MSRDNAHTSGSGGPKRRFELGCGPIFLVILLVAAPLAIRLGQLDREQGAVETIYGLSGTVIHGKETFATEWFQWLIPARVVSVNLAGTRATNADLAGLRSLTHLERLDLDYTAIAGGGLEPLAGLARLQTLSLQATGIGDDDLRELAGLYELATLKLAGTQVSDAGLACLDGLAALENLSIFDTKITAAGLAQLGDFAGLKKLEIGESQVTAAGVARLQAAPNLKQVSVHVPRGTGKRARDILVSLSGVDVSGFRRLPNAGASQSTPPNESRLWDGATPWEATTGGVVEAILAKAPLTPEQSERLLDVLAEAVQTGDWRRQGRPGFGSLTQLPVAKREPIKNNEEFFQALKSGDWLDFDRALAYARTGAARTAVAELLELLKSPDERPRRRAATILIRIGLSDPRVVAAIRDLLRSYDMHERARIVYDFDLSGWRWRHGDIVPEMDAAQAKVAVSLLLEVPEDEYWEVRSGIVAALADIVKEHPQEAERAIPVALKTLNDPQLHVRIAAPHALGTIAEASPGRAKAIVQQLLGMLQDEPGKAGREILEALERVAPQSAEAADVAVPALLRLLRDKNLIPAFLWGAGPNAAPPSPIAFGGDPGNLDGASVPETLGRIVERHPQYVKEIVSAAFQIIDDDDPWIELTASATLGSVAAGIVERNARPPATGGRSPKGPRP